MKLTMSRDKQNHYTRLISYHLGYGYHGYQSKIYRWFWLIMPKRLCCAKQWLILEMTFAWACIYSWFSLFGLYFQFLTAATLHQSHSAHSTRLSWVLTHHWLLDFTAPIKVWSGFTLLRVHEAVRGYMRRNEAVSTYSCWLLYLCLANDFDDVCSRAPNLVEDSSGAPLLTVAQILSSRNNRQRQQPTWKRLLRRWVCRFHGGRRWLAAPLIRSGLIGKSLSFSRTRTGSTQLTGHTLPSISQTARWCLVIWIYSPPVDSPSCAQLVSWSYPDW